MWINREVDLPELLVSAQSEGNLVIFAGAGVSMGPPANFPDFRALARRVAGNAMPPPTKKEPLDRYLGQAEALGVDVQSRTREILDDPSSQPTALHRDLLSLFRSPADVRVVTTNFDRHFTTAGREQFGELLDIYYSPALPLGRHFSGLVYLHGAVEQPRQRLVLTDRDFGQAYLTDGWATRMLMEMFARFTVLFVGYSHDDPVMNYLSRGLVPGTVRFALTTPGQEERWSHLGIKPVSFPMRPAPDEFGALPAAISAWVGNANRGTLDHENRIRELVQGPPPLERDAADYMEAALRDPVSTRFFTAHARSPEWLRWANDKGAFAPLFRMSEAAGPIAESIAGWFAQHYAVDHANVALALVARHGVVLNGVLWNAVARNLALREPRPDPVVLSAWTAILVRSAHPGWSRFYLAHLLSVCRYPEDRVAALLLFRHLTRPVLLLQPSYGDLPSEEGSLRLRAEIVLDGETYYLQEAWKALFIPHLEQLSADLAPVLTSHLLEAHAISQATGGASEMWDPASLHRSGIEPHEQDQFEAPVDVLIDAARDVVEWMVKNEPIRGDALVREWAVSAAPLLLRLALHGMTESPHLDADAALDFITERQWLYRLGLQHELFRLIARVYPQASEAARRRLIEHSKVVHVETGSATGKEARHINDYERYNVAAWLAQGAPGCKLASDHLAALQEAHPDFQIGEHPDLDHWMGEAGWDVLESPVSAEKLLSEEPAEWLELLVTYAGEGTWPGPTRDGLLVEVRSAIWQVPAWGLKLASALEVGGFWEGDLWEAVLDGWKAGSLEPEQWQDALLQIERIPTLIPLGRRVMALLQHGLESDAIPLTALGSVEHLTDRVIAVSEEAGRVSTGMSDDWLTGAINHIGGDAVQVWSLALSLRRRAEGDAWKGIPQSYRTRFESVLTSDAVNAQFGRAIIGRHAAFFFNIDPEWTRAHLLPLFNWDVAPGRAQQMWHGHLWGKWSDPLFAEMLSAYKQSFSRVDGELATMRKHLGKRLASIALRSTAHPLESGWLSDFVREAGAEAREHWTLSVGEALGALSPEAKEAAWESWIRLYWTERLTGVPRPLTNEEKQWMVQWARRLGPVFPRAVDMVCSAPVVVDSSRLIFYDMRTSDLGTLYPTPTARLIHHILRHLAELRYECGFVDEVVRRLSGEGADQKVLLLICEEMARLGCPTAAELKAAVLSAGPPE